MFIGRLEMQRTGRWVSVVWVVAAFICALQGRTVVGADPGASAPAAGKAKYVFLFIGDGMGRYQRAAATAYLRETAQNPDAALTMDAFPVQGETLTDAAGGGVTDSAAAGTALATGHKTKNKRIAMDASGREDLRTMAERARACGRKIGIITSVSLDHATPACFYAHVPSRNEYAKIARSAITTPTVDFLGGGGLLGQKQGDGTDLLEAAKKQGIILVRTRKALAAVQPGKRVYAFNHRLDKKAALPWVTASKPDDLTLAELTRHGIRLLDNPKGFFIMVEGGKIDWACHSNDLKSAVRETLAFDEAVAVAQEFAKARPADTLVVVTADHETGNLRPAKGGAGYRFGSKGHSAQAVPTSALGVGAERFKGKTHLVDISHRIAELMGLSE